MATILLIDGDSDTREILQVLLRWRGYDVFAAADAAAGLRLAHTHQPDVVVTEFLIPPASGNCVIEELRRMPGTAAIPAIVLTSNVVPEVQQRVQRAGGVFAAKPLPPTRVLQLVELVRSSPRAPVAAEGGTG